MDKILKHSMNVTHMSCCCTLCLQLEYLMYREGVFSALFTRFLQCPVAQWAFQWGIGLKVYGSGCARVEVVLLVELL
ncbi:hypothetical protein PAXRUDRAFT_835053 [Paxillus rubicundulus Ve08.2h10]|uniref:Uncharacterized protein n=1 Tax=Paxillus rubicundulus Ve08.2h10 TaxID=930991 RepID=A0A0D0D0Z6_9AGAM|nr:hypothetical protein PAXRUDRAFT_835053 [Paxillus rubicundulus Ve08.2h10]